MRKFLFFISSLGFLLASCTSKKGPVPVVVSGCDSTIHFSSNINVIVTNYCATTGCHDAGSGNGDFTTFTDISSKVGNGTFRNRVLVLKDMPQAGSPQLSDEQLKNISCWLEQGGQNN